jgi:hypothetical protein
MSAIDWKNGVPPSKFNDLARQWIISRRNPVQQVNVQFDLPDLRPKWEPIAHIPPLPPIDLHPIHTPIPLSQFEEMREESDLKLKIAEGERIWDAVIATAEATNQADG